MGKKVGKKVRSAHKGRKVASSSSQITARQEASQTAEVGVIVGLGDPVLKGRKACAHVDVGIHRDMVSSKLESRGQFKCDDCREGVLDRRAAEGKVKHGKKKGGGPAEGKADSKAIWICLECGQFSCGGIGLPTNPQYHAVRHARQSRHPLVIQAGNPHLRWCFPCSTLVPFDRLEENGDGEDVLSDIVKLIKRESPKGTSVNVEDVWFGSGSATADVKPGLNVRSCVSVSEFRAVRGLVNLGNTCFFNSIVQNLLAIGILQEYLLLLDGSFGHLTSSLKNLFIDTSPGTGMGNAVSPKSLFGCICDKAPQFRGYQQQDSHELLLYLLDGLSAEELSAKRLVGSSVENGKSLTLKPTFVDAIFGGQLSSTVCCVECGHSSVVYESFLDLSLSIPTKKPPSKKAAPLPRNRKTRFPPKRSGKATGKDKKEQVLVPAVDSSSYPSISGNDSAGLEPCKLPVVEQNGDSVGGSSSVDPFGHDNVAGPCFPMPLNYDAPTAHYPEDVSGDDTSWLDYLEPGPSSHEFDSTVHESIVDNDVPVLHDDNITTAQNSTPSAMSSDDFTRFDYIGPTSASDNVCVQSNDLNIAATMNSGTMDASQENAVLDTAASIEVVHARNGSPDSKSDTYNSWEDEQPLKVLGSEILLLPYKEETITGDDITKDFDSSSLVVDSGEDLLDFDGFGDLFDEPEVAIGPSLKPSSGAPDFHAGEGLGNGFLKSNTSESDPEEVDDTNLPVSVESCLAQFTKPELLSNEHAWHCENCSRESLKKRRKDLLMTDGRSASMVPCVKPVAEDEIRSGGDEKNALLNSPDSVLTDVSDEKKASNQAFSNCDVVTSSHVSANHISQKGSEKVPELVKETESGEDSEDDKKSECVKVMRDATKTILVSKTPSVLTIHLKRFNQDARGRFSKVNGHVKFKETINLGPFMNPRCSESGPNIYRLVGVVEHSGTMREGHYVAYVRGGDKSKGQPVWYYASDAYVRETSLEDVLRSEAYILFYEKT